MRPRLLPTIAVAVGAISLGGASAAPVAADCATDGGIAYEVELARGYAFVGEFEGQTMNDDGTSTLHWLVERDIHGVPTVAWNVPGAGCYNPTFRRGVTYAVSTATTEYLSTETTVAYRISADGRLHLVVWRVPESDYPLAFREVHRMSEFLDLLGPGLPATDAASVPAGLSHWRLSIAG